MVRVGKIATLEAVSADFVDFAPPVENAISAIAAGRSHLSDRCVASPAAKKVLTLSTRVADDVFAPECRCRGLMSFGSYSDPVARATVDRILKGTK